MKLIAKTMERVVIELTANEIEDKGFEFFWDKIRGKYKVDDYDVDSIVASRDNDKIIFVELISKRNSNK